MGKKDAITAAFFLEGINFQYVASSPLSRAMFGANEIMLNQEKNFQEDSLFKSILVDRGFAELNRGDWTGRTKVEIGEDNIKRFNQCDPNATPNNGESYAELKERVIQSRDALLQMTDIGRASCVVSHLQVTRSILR